MANSKKRTFIPRKKEKALKRKKNDNVLKRKKNETLQRKGVEAVKEAEYDVTIIKDNEAILQINCSRQIKVKIANRFKYRVKNYYFNPLYKKGVWDGYIRMFDYKNGTLPQGLYHKLMMLLEKDLGLRVWSEESLRPKKTKYTIKQALDAFHSLNLPEKYSSRDYQLEGVSMGIDQEKAILVSPTSSGKSLIIYLLFKYFFEKYQTEHGSVPDRKFILIVPTKNLVEQMYSDFIDYSQNILNEPDVFNPLKHVGRLHSDINKEGEKGKYVQSPILITTWQSLDKIEDDEYFKSFEFLIGDEAHSHVAKKLSTMLLKKLTNTKIRIGTTATYVREWKANKDMMEGLFGKATQLTTTKEMIERGEASTLEVTMIRLSYPKQERVDYARMDRVLREQDKAIDIYRKELAFIYNYNKRNLLIADYVMEKITKYPGNGIVLITEIENHGKQLSAVFSKKFGSTHLIYAPTASTGVDQIEKMRKTTEKNNNVIILATHLKLGQGMSINNLQHLFYCSPFKTDKNNVQAMGRVLRLDGKDNKAWVWDFVDDLRTKKVTNYAYSHAQERYQTYLKEGHKCNFETREIKC